MVGREHFLGASADAEIPGQSGPAHGSGGIDQDLRRACDVSPSFASAGMQEAVAADHPRLRIAQKSIGPARAREVLARLLGCVGADRQRADAARVEIVKPFLETP
jgi:hypothetical protein